MLQYSINVLFAGTAIFAVFVIFDSCRKALYEFQLLMHERELMGPAGAAIDPDNSLQSDDPKPTEWLGPKLQGVNRIAISVQLRAVSNNEPLGLLPNVLWHTPRRVLGGSGELELISCTVGTAQLQAVHAEDAL